MVRFGGPFVRLNVRKLDAAKAGSTTLRNVFARYADCMLAQIFQSTACNAIQKLGQQANPAAAKLLEIGMNLDGTVDELKKAQRTLKKLLDLHSLDTEAPLNRLVQALEASTSKTATCSGPSGPFPATSCAEAWLTPPWIITWPSSASPLTRRPRPSIPPCNSTFSIVK
jgi:hypothetical protein